MVVLQTYAAHKLKVNINATVDVIINASLIEPYLYSVVLPPAGGLQYRYIETPPKPKRKGR